MKIYVTIFILSCLLLSAKAQENPKPSALQDKTLLSFGIGPDYGAFGVNFLTYPQKNIGIFGGAGYALAGFGYNVGMKFRIFGEHLKVMPYFAGMYGYNAVIVVTNETALNKIFYGPTFGVGVDFRFKPLKKGYWSFALLVPVRKQEVNDYMNDLQNYHGVKFDSKLSPVLISIGYRIILDYEEKFKDSK